MDTMDRCLETTKTTWALRSGTRVALVIWLTMAVLVGASLLARHLLPLARPGDAELASSMAGLRGPGGAGRPIAVHVLYADCRCSKLIAEHLASTVRPTNIVEHVLLAGQDDALAARLV